MTEGLSREAIIVLVDERISKHDIEVNKPQHLDNQNILSKLADKVGKLSDDIIAMKAEQSVVMKCAGAGIIIWSIKQIVDLAHSFIH